MPAPLVEGNDSRLGQVFVNLLVNATQALAEDGKQNLIVVATGTDARGWGFAAVTDNGKGIAPDTMKRIFDPFFTTKPPGQGTGLGLSISYQIVQDHGGRIELQPADCGAHFAVFLPLKPAIAGGERRR